MKKKWEQGKLPMEELREITEEERGWEAVIEAVLFTMGKSVEVRQLAAAIEQEEAAAREAVLRLKRRYDSDVRGMQIIELEDSFQMCTRAEYYDNLIRVASTPKKQVLTDVVLETLSIIAYKQPVTKLEIEKIRGVKSDHAVNRLVEYNLVYEVGRLDAPGRPALFATTEEFLRRFGIGSTQNLPTPDPEAAAEIRMAVEEELSGSGEVFPDNIPLSEEELPGLDIHLTLENLPHMSQAEALDEVAAARADEDDGLESEESGGLKPEEDDTF